MGGKMFLNVEMSFTGTRNNCGANASGTTATYTVAAGTYTSKISQIDADAQAQADINANAQAYINTNATCVLWTPTLVRPTVSPWTVPAGITNVDVFLVGGGGGGGTSGGGGGYTKTFLNVPVSPGQAIPFVIGAGGNPAPNTNTVVQAGYSEFLNSSYRAEGGYSGNPYNYNMGSYANSGNGGSGGGIDTYDFNGKSDGGSSQDYSVGQGQGTTTRDFGDPSGALNAGGGGGAPNGIGGDGQNSGYGFPAKSYGDEGAAGGGGGYGGGGGGSYGNPSYRGKGGDGTVLIRYYLPP